MREQTSYNRHTPTSIRGFTLVELMVTMAIFITVITIATGALFSAQAVNVRLQQTQVILDEVNLVMEMMVRDIRYGATFYCDTSVPSSAPLTRRSCQYPNGGTVLIFRPVTILSGSTDQLKDRVAYYVENSVLYKREYPFGQASRTFQLTSADIKISKLSFYAIGVQSVSGTNDYTAQSDMDQPLMTVVVSGTTVPQKAGVSPVTFRIQSSASSRGIDN